MLRPSTITGIKTILGKQGKVRFSSYMKRMLIRTNLHNKPGLLTLGFTAGYILFSITFIWLGDFILLHYPGIRTIYQLTVLQSLKAIIYLFITGIIFYFLAFHFFREYRTKSSEARENLYKYRKIVESTYDGIALLDEENKITYANHSFCTLLGYPAESLLNRNIMLFLAEKKGKAAGKYAEMLLPEKNRPARIKMIKNGGENIIVNFSVNDITDREIRASRMVVIHDMTGVDSMEKELEFTYEKYQKIVDLSPQGIIVSRNGQLIFGNQSILRIFGGKSLRDFEGRFIYDFVHPDYRAFIQKRQEVLNSKSTSLPFTRIKCFRMDGRIIDVEIASASFRVSGQIFSETIIKDITKQLKNEKKLKESEEQLRLALKSANQALYDLNLQTGEAVLSGEYAAMLGYDPEKFRGSRGFVQDLLHPDDRERVMKDLRKCEAGGTAQFNTEFRLKSASGKWIWLMSKGKVVEYDTHKRPLRLVGILTNITRLKEIENDLKMKERQFRNALMQNPLPTMIHKADGEIIEINKAWQKASGYTPGDLQTIEDWINKAYVKNKKEIAVTIRKSCRHDKPMDNGEYTIRCKNGESRTWHFFTGCLDLGQTMDRIIISTAIDVTEKRKAEIELQEYHDNLENLIAERTLELEEKNKDLERVNQLFVGREFRIKELRDKVKELEGVTRIRHTVNGKKIGF